MNNCKWNHFTICKIDFTTKLMIMGRKQFKMKMARLIINKMKKMNFIIKKEILSMKILKSKGRIHILKKINIKI